MLAPSNSFVSATSEPALPCSRCGEPVAEGFDACWRCGTALPESTLVREPGPDVEALLAADAAAARAELEAMQRRPVSLRSHAATGIAAALTHLAFDSGLVDAQGEAVRQIVLAPEFRQAIGRHALVIAAYLGCLALWRRWRRRRQRVARVHPAT